MATTNFLSSGHTRNQSAATGTKTDFDFLNAMKRTDKDDILSGFSGSNNLSNRLDWGKMMPRDNKMYHLSET
jgi:hypothetical protein